MYNGMHWYMMTLFISMFLSIFCAFGFFVIISWVVPDSWMFYFAAIFCRLTLVICSFSNVVYIYISQVLDTDCIHILPPWTKKLYK